MADDPEVVPADEVVVAGCDLCSFTPGGCSFCSGRTVFETLQRGTHDVADATGWVADQTARHTTPANIDQEIPDP